MLLYLHGPDSYLREEALRGLLEKYRMKHPVSRIESFELVDADTLPQFKTFLQTQSLFASDKLGIIHGLDTDVKELPGLIRAYKDGKETTLILTVPKALPKAYAFLENEAIYTASFDVLKGADFLAFLKSEVLKRGITLSPADTQKMARSYEGDTWGVVRELEKLALGGTLDDPLALPEFFPLIQSLKNPLLAKRVTALAVLLEREEAAAVFNILATLVGKELKTKMADYDVAVKSGKLEYEEALTDFVIGN